MLFFFIGIYAFQPSLMLSSHFIIQETSLVSQIWQECIVYLSQGKLITTKTIFEYQKWPEPKTPEVLIRKKRPIVPTKD